MQEGIEFPRSEFVSVYPRGDGGGIIGGVWMMVEILNHTEEEIDPRFLLRWLCCCLQTRLSSCAQRLHQSFQIKNSKVLVVVKGLKEYY